MGKHIGAILWKQGKDTLKNKTILIQFIMFPLLTLVMENTVSIEGMQPHFFVNLFAVMYLGMAPLTSMAAVISEEKETNTLRVLLLSDVKPIEYLIGVSSHIWLICMLGALVMGLGGGYSGGALVRFLLVMGVGVLVSMLIGAAIGTASKNQMVATSITVPVMMVFSFLPMIGMFNTSIEKVAKIFYSEQIHQLINQMGGSEVSFETIVVIAVNMLIAIILFAFSYKRSGLA